MIERAASAGNPPLTLFGLASVLLRGWRSIVLCGLLAGAIAATVTLLSTRMWTSRASFTPQQRRNAAPGNLGGLAAQLGVNVPGADGSQSVFFYAELIRSRELLREVVTARYAAAGATRTLVDWLDIRGENEAERIDNAIRVLGGQRLVVSADAKTNIVRMAVSVKEPELARQVAAGILERVNRFNLEKRQSQARAERVFSERRLQEMKRELEQAEDRLQEFRQRNRTFLGSSDLRVAEGRLEREVSLRQRLFAALAESYEQSRVEEVRDTPVITVLESPEVPAQPDRRFLALKTVLATIAGSVVTALLLLAGVVLRRLRRDDEAGWDALVGGWRAARRRSDAGRGAAA
ncbi:MAG: Wzz/FepE/Etk N-terminal domain-containing protein [Gemmatimonadaceae bacterium]|nr:Wzz/FepE/Etk N-terminal domain-containing protein [Gemmatimonadaceae bacterium]